jgi:hypothetical protein
LEAAAVVIYRTFRTSAFQFLRISKRRPGFGGLILERSFFLRDGVRVVFVDAAMMRVGGAEGSIFASPRKSPKKLRGVLLT